MDCLIDLGLVHWLTGPLFGVSAGVVGFVLGRLRVLARMHKAEEEVMRWSIVAKSKGWHYSVTPLRRTDMHSCSAHAQAHENAI